MLRTLLCALVVLVLGTLLRSGSFLVHAHGDDGAHLHVGDAEDQVLAEHRAHAAHGDGNGPALVPASDDDAAHEDGVRLVLAAPVPLGLLGCESCVHPPQAARAPDEPVHACAVAVRHTTTGAGPPGTARSAKERSGTAALLTTSRALLL